MDATQQAVRQQVRMRGRSYVAFVFSPVVPIVSWLTEIDATLAKSPGFFAGKPVVLDLSAVDLSQSAITHLVGSLGERNIRILGIEGVDESKLGPNMPSLLLESPVRSGQSIVFAEGDVTVLGSVGSGAEIVAGGSIHVYGTLRGRAMAGINGNSSARIFCQKIEAELLAIDGYYQTAEEIADSLRNRPAQAWLEGEMLRITPLN
jgi:septum site-determining protein MinC